jgi:signal transduction histidine kinase
MENKRQRLSIVLAAGWLVMTVALIIWWMYFALSLIAQLETNVSRHQTMLFWEGATLLTLLVAGGATLIYFILREKKRTEQIQNLFSSFTHDIKTRLAGVKLIAEGLATDIREQNMQQVLQRLLTDVSRLQVQVENSLFISGHKSEAQLGAHIEKVKLSEVVEILRDSWPQIEIVVKNDAWLNVDRRLFESILTNLWHNSLTHGEASLVNVTVKPAGAGRVQIIFEDNGTGFNGNPQRLGEVFYRHQPKSGTGLGLFTVREYLHKMQGEVDFQIDKSFKVLIEVSGELV